MTDDQALDVLAALADEPYPWMQPGRYVWAVFRKGTRWVGLVLARDDGGFVAEWRSRERGGHSYHARYDWAAFRRARGAGPADADDPDWTGKEE